MSKENPRHLISSIGAAKSFKKSNDYIALLCRRGKIYGELIDRVWYVDPASLAAYLSEQEVKRQERRQELSQQLLQEYRANIQSAPKDSATLSRVLVAVGAVAVLAFVTQPVVPMSLRAGSQLGASALNSLQHLQSGFFASSSDIRSDLFARAFERGGTSLNSLLSMLTGSYSPRTAVRTESSPQQPAVSGEVVTPAKVVTAFAPAAAPVSTGTPRVVTRTIVERIVTKAPEDHFYTDTQIQLLRNSLSSEIYKYSSAQSAGSQVFTTLAPAQRISQLGGIQLTNVTVSSVSGLTDADIPDTITASGYLPISGGTLGGSLTVGSITATTSLSVLGTSNLSGLATFAAGFLSSASSTIGDGSRAGGLTVSGGATTTGNAYFAGNVGIGTSTGQGLLSLLQSQNGTTILAAQRMTDTAPSGDFISYRAMDGTLLYRVDNSGNIYAGGITNSGSLTITSASAPQFRVQYDPSNEWTSSVGSTGTTTLAFNGANSSAVFTTQNNNTRAFTFADANLNSILSIDSTNRRVGIGTTSPVAALSVQGNQYTSGTAFFGGAITATSSLTVSGVTTFTGGFSSYASTTIGNGNQTGGLTVSGGATTTGNMYIAGRLGVGAVNPTEAIHIRASSGTVRNLLENTSPTGFAEFQEKSDTGDFRMGISGSSGTPFGAAGMAGYFDVVSDNPLLFGTHDSIRMAITNTGNVGIGTMTPDVLGGLASFTNRLEVSGAGAAIGASVGPIDDHVGVLNVRSGNNLWQLSARATNENNRFGLYFFNGSTYSNELLSFTTGGNLGLGTTSPTNKLEVAGNTFLGGNLTATGTATISGKVGIGRAPTSYTLDINGTLAVNDYAVLGKSVFASGGHSDDDGGLRFTDPTGLPRGVVSAANGYAVSIGTNANNFGPQDLAHPGVQMYLDGRGAYGRFDVYTYDSGTGAEHQPLHLTDTNTLDVGNGFNTNDSFASLYVKDNRAYGAKPTMRLDQNGDGTTDIFQWYDGSSNKLGEITGTGSLGIGTTSPSSALSVQGNAYTSGTAFFGGAITATSTLSVTGLTTLSNASTTQISSTGSAYFATAGGNVGIGTLTPGAKLDVIAPDNSSIIHMRLMRSSKDYGIDMFNNGSSGNSYINYSGSGALLTFQANGSDKIVFDSSGNVGIGNTPTKTLDVTGTGRFSGTLTLSGNTTCTGSQALQTNGSGDISCGTISVGGSSTGGGWTTNNIGSISLSTTTDRVAIGATTTPYAKLTIMSGSTATTTLAIVPGASQTANIIDIYNTSGALSSVLTAAGNLGLGTTSPSNTFEVWKNQNAGTWATVNNTTVGATSNAGVQLVSDTATTYLYTLSSAYGLTSNAINQPNGGVLETTGTQGLAIGAIGTGGQLRFYTNSASGERMRIDATGGVGISSSTPWAKLSINNSTNDTAGQPLFAIASSTASATTTLLVVTNSGYVGVGTTTPGKLLDLYNNTNSGAGMLRLTSASNDSVVGGVSAQLVNNLGNIGVLAMLSSSNANYGVGNAVLLDNTSNNPIIFGTNDTIRMTIAAGGNIGIGTTSPSALFSVHGNSYHSGTAFFGGAITATSTLTLSPLGTPAGTYLAVDATGKLIATTTPTSSSSFAYLFPNNATTTLLTLGGGFLSTASSTINGNLVIIGNSTTTNATTTTFAISSIASGSFLKTTTGGAIVPAVLGTDYTNYAYLFPNNATSTLLQFNGNASTTQLSATQAFFGGTATSTFTTTGFLGIGTAAPQWNLQVAGTRPSFALSDTSAGTNLKHWLFSSMGGNLYVGTSTDVFATSTPAALTVSNAGLIGMGTAAPTYKLDVSGLGHFTGLVDAANFVATSTTATSTFAGGFNAGGSTGLTAYPSGSIGIGAAPTAGYPLEITNSGGTLLQLTRAATGVSRINLTGGLGAVVDSGTLNFTSTNAVASQGFLFTARNSSNTSVDSLYINNTGNVGIGTTTPLATLSVNGQTANYQNTIFSVGSTTAAGTTTSLFAVLANGNVGIGTTSPAQTFSVQGNVYTSGTTFFGGAITATSTLTLSALAVPAGTFLAADATGKLIATSTPVSGSSFAYPFLSNATSTLLSFNAGLLAFASSTIGNGTQAGGLTISGGATTTGNLVVLGNGTSTFAGGLSAGVLNITSSVATSTFANGIDLASGCFAMRGTCISSGGGSGTVNSGTQGQFAFYNALGTAVTGTSTIFLDVNTSNITFNSNLLTFASVSTTTIPNNTPYAWAIATSSTGIPLLQFDTTSGAEQVVIGAGGNDYVTVDSGVNVGIGTTTPWRTLTVVGYSDLGTNALAGYFTATSTFASAFSGGFTAFASSTIGNGTQAGGLTIFGGATTTGNSLISGALTVTGNTSHTGTLTQTGLATFINGLWSTASSTIGAGTQASGLTIFGGATTTGNAYFASSLGIGTTSPWATLSVEGTSTLGNSATAGYFTATSTTASTFAGGITAGASTINGNLAIANPYVLSMSGGTTRIDQNGRFFAGAGTASTPAFCFSNDCNSGIYLPAVGALGFSTNVAERMRLTSAGNLGIGTTSPLAQLTVATQNGATGSLANLFLVASSTATATTTLFNIMNTGNVGIGTTSPGALLSVAGTVLTNAILPNGTYTNNLSAYDLGATGSRWNALWAGTVNIGTSTFSLAANSASGLGFYNAASGGGTQVMTIATGGNVGIGTTTPNSKLSLELSGTSGTVSALTLSTAQGAVGDGASIDFYAGAYNRNARIYDYAINSNAGQLRFATANGGSFVDAMTVSNTGSVGIGTTSPLATLSVQAATNVTPFLVASSTGATLLSVDSTGALTAKLKQLTADYTPDSGSPTIAVGDMVAYINGNVEKAHTSCPNCSTYAANSVTSSKVNAAMLDSTHFVLTYLNTSTNRVQAIIGVVSGFTITYGTAVNMDGGANASTNYPTVAALSSTKFVVAYADGANSGKATATVGTVSGTTITAGTPAQIGVNGSAIQTSVAALDSTHFATSWSNGGNTTLEAVVSSVSGTNVTGGSWVTLVNAFAASASTAALDSTHFVVSYRGNDCSNCSEAIVSSVSGTTITSGSSAIVNSNSVSDPASAALDATHFVTASPSNSGGTSQAVVSVVSGTTITSSGTVVTLDSTNRADGGISVAAIDSTHFVASYANSQPVTAIVSSVSGTTITAGTSAQIGTSTSPALGRSNTVVMDSTHFVTGFSATGNQFANAIIAPTTFVTASSKMLGMATAATSTNNNLVTVALDGIVSGLSGLTAGSTYYWSVGNGLTTTAGTNYPVGIALTTSSILLNSNFADTGAKTDQFFGDAVFANNFRIAENALSPQGLTFKNQLGREIANLDENGNLSISGALSALNITPNTLNLLGTTTALELTLATSTATSTDSALLPEWAGAFSSASDSLKANIQTLADTVIQVVGHAIYATTGIFEKVFAKEVHTDKVCVSDNTGETCITKAQLDSLLAAAAASGGGQGTSTPDTTPPNITINGNNPAELNVGDSYVDLGASITGPAEDVNLGISTFVDGVLINTPAIDTSVSGTHTIDYVATDASGNTATSTRTVIVNPITP